MAEHPDVLVLGGGVIGLTTAYFLAGAGARVALLDKGDFGQQASWAGAGIIPPGNPERAPTPFDRLRAHSSALYPALSRQLREETGLDNGYVVCGGLELLDGVEGTFRPRSPRPRPDWLSARAVSAVRRGW
jgi:glycine oxidase